MKKRGLKERLDNGGVICAEGYLFEMERRGYLTAGEFVPEVALEYPEALRNLDDTRGCTCPSPHGRTFPTALDPLYCNRYEIRRFAEEAWKTGINYIGVCCGAAPIHIREVAEAIGRTPEASRFSENMQKHFMYGSDKSLPEHITGYGDKA